MRVQVGYWWTTSKLLTFTGCQSCTFWFYRGGVRNLLSNNRLHATYFYLSIWFYTICVFISNTLKELVQATILMSCVLKKTSRLNNVINRVIILQCVCVGGDCFNFERILIYSHILHACEQRHICVCIFSMSYCNLLFPFHIVTHTHKHTQSHTLLLLQFILQNPTAWYYCNANLNMRYLSSRMQCVFLVYSERERDREGERDRERESWHKRPQTPQMGFQSILINLSPWGLLSAVICLLPWLPRSVSFMPQSLFTSVIPRMQGNPQLHQRSHPASRAACGNENRAGRCGAADPAEPPFVSPSSGVSRCIFGVLRRWEMRDKPATR